MSALQWTLLGGWLGWVAGYLILLWGSRKARTEALKERQHACEHAYWQGYCAGQRGVPYAGPSGLPHFPAQLLVTRQRHE